MEAFESKALKAESERSAAEAALAQCVREYAKERAQKARLQQQISALQKRLLQTQITELQNTVLIGGRQIDPSASPSLASAADDDFNTPGAADDAPPTEKLRAERRKTDRLDGRVRALTGRVHELQAELRRAAAPSSVRRRSGRSAPRRCAPFPTAGRGRRRRRRGRPRRRRRRRRRCRVGACGQGPAMSIRARRWVAVRRGLEKATARATRAGRSL